jgi:hypothetical protein
MTNSASEAPVDRCGNYSQALRALGCALEATHVEAFEISCDAPNFLIKVQSQECHKPQLEGRLKRTVTQVLQRVFSNQHDVELIYTPERLKRLDHEFQLRRRSRGILDPHSLPQSLRALGAYLDVKGARLVRISKRGPCTTMEYESSQDRHTREEFTPKTLYELFVQSYVKRSDRVKTRTTEVETR